LKSLPINYYKLKNMKKHLSRMVIGLIFIIPGILLSSCKEKDSKIQAAVETSLKNSGMPEISATVKDGVATLSGECKSDADKAAVESMIAKVKGVKQVVNNCSVAPPPPAPAPVVIAADDPLSKGVTDAIKDYPGVKADVKDGVVTLTGDIKRAELKKLMETLHTLKPKKIDNKLTIK
jgi:hyperosmotically inducible protein